MTNNNISLGKIIRILIVNRDVLIKYGVKKIGLFISFVSSNQNLKLD